MNIHTQIYHSPVGELILGEYNDQLVLADWKYRDKRTQIDARIQAGLNATYIEQATPLHRETIDQLESYFAGNRTAFTIPLHWVGTDFQKRVWTELLRIPFGQTTGYLDLAKQLNNEKAVRAVAAANGANAISIFVPCHRIIGSNGALVGYAGGLSAKSKLLQLENAFNQVEINFSGILSH